MADLNDTQPVEMWVGDSAPHWVFLVVDDQGEPLPIADWVTTGATLRLVNVETQAVVLGEGTLTITDAGNGEIVYDLGADDTTNAGEGVYDVLLRIDMTGTGGFGTRQWPKHVVIKKLPVPEA